MITLLTSLPSSRRQYFIPFHQYLCMASTPYIFLLYPARKVPVVAPSTRNASGVTTGDNPAVSPFPEVVFSNSPVIQTRRRLLSEDANRQIVQGSFPAFSARPPTTLVASLRTAIRCAVHQVPPSTLRLNDLSHTRLVLRSVAL